MLFEELFKKGKGSEAEIQARQYEKDQIEKLDGDLTELDENLKKVSPESFSSSKDENRPESSV